MNVTKSKVFEIIVGVEFCDEIQRRGEVYSESCWSIAVDTMEAIERMRAVKSAIVTGDIKNPPYANYILAFGMMDVYYQMAWRYGVRIRTIMDYVSIADYYEADTIERYKVLPFSHFRYAKTTGEHSIKVLELSLKEMDRKDGRPPSVAWLKANLYRVTGNANVVGDVEAVQEFDSIAATITTSDFQPPENNNDPLPASVYYFVNSICRVLESLRKRLPETEIEDSKIARITDLIEATQQIADEIRLVLEQECNP